MTAFNVVRFRVKPGRDEEFIDAHKVADPGFSGMRRFSMVHTGPGTYCIIGEWDSFEAYIEDYLQETEFFRFLDYVPEDMRGYIEVDVEQTVADTNPRRTPWREYYKARALVTITRRHLGPLVTALTAIRLGLGGARLLVRRHGPGLARARVEGVADGLRGRLGVRRYDPEGNPPKNSSH